MDASPSIKFTLWLNRGLMALVSVLALAMPRLIVWYNTVRILSQQENLAIVVAFYCCVPVALFALWSLERLLRNITQTQVFISDNVRRIRRVCLCCALVGLICLPASFFYPPLIFLVIIMAFLCPVVNVVCQVFKAAIALREENDLTI